MAAEPTHQTRLAERPVAAEPTHQTRPAERPLAALAALATNRHHQVPTALVGAGEAGSGPTAVDARRMDRRAGRENCSQPYARGWPPLSRGPNRRGDQRSAMVTLVIETGSVGAPSAGLPTASSALMVVSMPSVT